MQRLFMIWFLVALGVLFAGSVVLYAVTWSLQDSWPPPGSPSLPLVTLALATLLIIISSVTMNGATRAAFRDRQDTLTRSLGITLALGLGFLVVQIYNWAELAAAHLGREPTLFSFLFYSLTAVHAAHVIAGIVPLIVALVRARRGAYRGGKANGIRMLGWYWHFLDAVWLVLVGLIVVSYAL